MVAEDGHDWKLMLLYIFFGIQEVPQASTEFTPFKLLFVHQHRGLLNFSKEAWEQQPALHRTVIEHVQEMRKQIERLMPLVKEHLVVAQHTQQQLHDRPTQAREFQPGDRGLELVPTATSKFLASWQGPFTIAERVTYRAHQSGWRKEEQLYHINLLKKCLSRTVGHLCAR